MTELVGWIGAILFSCCGIPQAIKTYKTKSVNDFSLAFLLMWGFGEVFTFYYVLTLNIQADKFQIPLLANYIMNFFIVVYLIYVKWRN